MARKTRRLEADRKEEGRGGKEEEKALSLRKILGLRGSETKLPWNQGLRE